MDLNQIMDNDAIVLNVTATSKKQALKQVAGILATKSGLNERDIFDALVEREKLGSTALGGGVAIPHGKSERAQSIHCVVVRLAEAIEFEAADDEPVDIIVSILAPEQASTDHLKILAKISKVLRDKANTEAIRTAETAADLLATFISANGQSNAA